MNAIAELFHGVIVPALTPFTSKLEPDTDHFIRFCQWLLAEGANGLAVFGTTSEANSLGLSERISLLQALVEADVPAQNLLPGTGTCALPDTLELTRHALSCGCGGVLVLPPFYYKNVSDDGLYAAYSELIERIGDSRLRLYLYHIPQLSHAPLSLKLIGRLVSAYPQTVVGIKDSSGNWENTQALLLEYPQLAIFPASENRLLETLQLGGAGCISATANINVRNIRQLIDHYHAHKGVGELQQGIKELRSLLENYPFIPALKEIMAHYQQASWRTLRPPLCNLSSKQADQLLADITKFNLTLYTEQRHRL